MEKFNYGTFDPSVSDGPFMDSSYTEPTSEQMTRKELSFPLHELKDFLNSTLPTNSADKIVALKLTAENLIQYSLDGETWYDTAAGGHIIYNDQDEALPQKTKMMFKDTNVYNAGDYTIIEGLVGQQGVSVSSIVQTTESSVSEGSNIWTATLSNGDTYDFVVKNGAKGDDGEKGDPGDGLIILGTYAALEDLQSAHPTGNEGDIYIVGTSDSNPAYVWDTDDEAWESIGKIRGEKGAKGDTGATGATGTSIQSIVDETPSSTSGASHSIKVTLTNGAENTFTVYNGEAGAAGEGMKTGGTTGQALVKKSNTDYDTEWKSLKTINSTSLLGADDLSLQTTLVSGTNIKTINNSSILSSGDLSLQPTLVSGTSIKTLDGESLLGSGNISTSNTYTSISVSGTPTAISYNAWDTQNKYGYKLDITVSGVTENSVILNIVMTDTILDVIAPVITTGEDKITVYTEDATALSGTIQVLVTREV